MKQHAQAKPGAAIALLALTHTYGTAACAETSKDTIQNSPATGIAAQTDTIAAQAAETAELKQRMAALMAQVEKLASK